MRNPLKKLRYLKWWSQRLKGDLPACDIWEYKYALVKNIEQGLSYLLYEGMTDWDNVFHKKDKEELEYVLKWAKEFPYYDQAVLIKSDWDDETKRRLTELANGKLVLTEEEWVDWERRTQKAFEILAKQIHGLWD